MRIAIAVILFSLSAFTSLGDGRIRISLLTILLALGSFSVLLSHFRSRKK